MGEGKALPQFSIFNFPLYIITVLRVSRKTVICDFVTEKLFKIGYTKATKKKGVETNVNKCK